MKLIGFVFEYNPIPDSTRITESLPSKQLTDLEIEKICQYLHFGKMVIGWMGYFQDFKTKEFIAPDSYLTDGVWVWPSYLSYYLNKGFHNLLNVDLLHHVRTRYYEMDDCLEVKQNMNVLEQELSDIFKKYP